MKNHKTKQKDKELISSLKKIDRNVFVLEIKLIGLSKIKDNLLYNCKYIDNGVVKSVPIIAYDVTQALAKLTPYVDADIPEDVLKIMLGNERYNY